MIFKVIAKLYFMALFPAAWIYITIQSEISRFRNLGKKPVIRFETDYAGQKIMLLALYQKGELRADTIRLLQTAKDAGMYTVAVNTLKVKNPDALRDLIGCYIERPNYGRDFGSYRNGFLHVFKRGWDKTCPRLLMINDSVFFTHDRMPKFLADMMADGLEVLGSTENYDIDYHLGSFCIAMAQPILQNKTFKDYWRDYKLTDVRPTVIKRGELELSRVLKRIVSAQNQFNALYSADRYLKLLAKDDDLLEFAVTHARGSRIFAWKRASLKGVVEEFRERYLMRRFDFEEEQVKIDASKPEFLEERYLNSFADLVRYFKEILPEGEQFDPQVLRDIIVSDFAESFMSGSQIHQNAAIMLRLGLPIVKLDALYRGICDLHDIRKVLALLPQDEADELQAQLISRPYGGRYLTGLKRAAFERGLI